MNKNDDACTEPEWELVMKKRDREVLYMMFRYLCDLLWIILQEVRSGPVPDHIHEEWAPLDDQLIEWRDADAK